MDEASPVVETHFMLESRHPVQTHFILEKTIGAILEQLIATLKKPRTINASACLVIVVNEASVLLFTLMKTFQRVL